MSGCPLTGGERRGITYGGALNISELLTLQKPFSESPVHDELQYVIIHQCSELWFKLLLHELDAVVAALQTGDSGRAARLLRRAGQIVGLIDQGFSLMETMTAYDYALFRPNLSGGSGFQSAQFRELEILLSCQTDGTLDQPAFTAEERARIARRLQEPNLWDAFVAAMRKSGYDMPARAEAVQDPGKVTRLLREMYAGGTAPGLREVSEELAALDNALTMWRTHHAVMAERAIGAKVGTGGEGVEYLYRTARKRCFPELFAFRTEL
ncbi:MAG TPA: tryptophan 2,3-dioxygenase family protein [Symbiobacteriaceae bacterium]|nr:tryptophan 2,3-dioxygenase family protein [Symbiobacteriaceae bacterium]